MVSPEETKGQPVKTISQSGRRLGGRPRRSRSPARSTTARTVSPVLLDFRNRASGCLLTASFRLI